MDINFPAELSKIDPNSASGALTKNSGHDEVVNFIPDSP